MNKILMAAAIVSLLLLSLCVSDAKAVSGQIDRSAIVSNVFDGDTFVLDSGEIVRLADVNTPEVGQAGYSVAKDFVISLVEGKTVYLDIDNKTTYDSYGRLVCVAYFNYNSTHYENLNEALLEGNFAVVDDFDNNDFSPSDWSLYIQKTMIPEIPSWILVALIALAIIVALASYKKIKK